MKRFMFGRLSQAAAARARFARGIAGLVFAGLFTASCDVHRLGDPGSLSRIEIAPTTQTLAVTGTQQFVAKGFDFSGLTVETTPVWSVVAGGGTISADGMFTAGTSPKTYTNTIMATVGTLTATATIIVIPGPLASILVTPNTTMMVGTGQQFVAVGSDAYGNVVSITPNWSVVAGGGVVNGTGMFTAGMLVGTFTNTVQASSGLILGSATVIATAGPLATITVSPTPTTLGVSAARQFTAVGKDASGNLVTITPTWTVVDANAGTIDAATGLFTASQTLGTYANTAKATSGSISGTASVTVTAGALSSITIAPNPAQTGINATQQFTAIGRDASGNIVAITPAWAVVNGGGTIGLSSGLWTAGTVLGTFASTVRANVGSVVGFQTVTVTGGAVATIDVVPHPVTVKFNAQQQFTAVGRDAAGNVVPTTVYWTMMNPAAGTINASGLYTASSNANTYPNVVRANNGGSVSGHATITVSSTGPALTTIVVTPNPASVQTNGSRQFTATGLDQNGNPVTITPTWSVVNGGGTINTTGSFTAGPLTGTFNNTVQATTGSVSGNATVNVTSPSSFTPIVSLGTAGANGIMAGTAFTCVSLGTINADIAISPGSTVTGFPPCTITGTQHLNDGIAIQNQIDLTTAYNTLKGLPCPPANAIVANLGGTTKPAGVYCTASGIGVTGTLTLDGGGNPNAEFVFQAGSSLTTAGNIVLINGAQARNVYWQVGSSATLGTASQWQGNIIALTSITLVDNANLFGRALARNGGVSLGTGNTITLP